MLWINEKEKFVKKDEFGNELENVEVIKRKFDELKKEMVYKEYRVNEVNELEDKMVEEGNKESENILYRKEELNEEWMRIKKLDLMRKEKMFGENEIKSLKSDEDEKVEWIYEKDVVL
jgi:hypothetical protein